MEIHRFDDNNSKYVKEAAELLVESFPHAYADCADEEMKKILESDRIALMAVEDNRLHGFVGAIPQYGNTGWELHPLVVKQSSQFKGIGTMLITALEREVKACGGLTLYLGTDDEFGKTSLSEGDLFEDTFEKIAHIRNYQQHPYEFYMKMGYRIVGVLPDANGRGKPDIWMAKRIG